MEARVHKPERGAAPKDTAGAELIGFTPEQCREKKRRGNPGAFVELNVST
jgi:hypothetical protein